MRHAPPPHSGKDSAMNIDTEKVDDTVLALLYLTSFEYGRGIRAWKGHDWDALNRLYDKGMVGNPRSKAKSIPLSEDGAKRGKRAVRQVVYQAVVAAAHRRITRRNTAFALS